MVRRLRGATFTTACQGPELGCDSAEAAVQRKLCLGRSSVALITLILASCGKAAPPGAATREAWAQFQACVTSVIDKCPATIRMDVSDNQDGCRCGVRAKVGRSPTVG
jgi:hypothetical protein